MNLSETLLWKLQDLIKQPVNRVRVWTFCSIFWATAGQSKSTRLTNVRYSGNFDPTHFKVHTLGFIGHSTHRAILATIHPFFTASSFFATLCGIHACHLRENIRYSCCLTLLQPQGSTLGTQTIPQVCHVYPLHPCGAVPSGPLRVSTGTPYCRMSSFHGHKLKRRNDMFQFLLHLPSYLHFLSIWKSLEIPTGIFCKRTRK